MKNRCIEQMAQTLSPVRLQGGDHVNGAGVPVLNRLAPCTCAGHRLPVTGDEEEALGMEAGVVDQVLAAPLDRPVAPDVSLHNGTPCGFVSGTVGPECIALGDDDIG